MVRAEGKAQGLSIVCTLPAEFQSIHFRLVDAAVENDGIHAELAVDLGKLGNLTPRENIIASLHGLAKISGKFMAHDNVSCQGFAVDKVLCREGVPGTCQNPAFADEFFNFIGPFRTHLNVVIHHGNLAVGMEIGKAGISLHNVQQIIHCLNKAVLRFVNRPPILSVPVGIDDQAHIFHAFFLTHL